MVLTEDGQSASWKALRIFTYWSIIANLVAAGCAIWATVYLSWIPLSFKIDAEYGISRCGRKLGVYGSKYAYAIDLVRQTPVFRCQYYSAVAWYGIGLILTFLAIAT